MFDTIFSSTAETMGASLNFLVCTLASLILGAAIAFTYMYKSRYNKSFVVTLALLPLIVQVVIMFVNGNLGTGVAVAGAFSLVRFRSVPGSAKEIGSIFMAMALGLGTGMGYIGTCIIFTLVICAASIFYYHSKIGSPQKIEKELKVTIPEGLDYTGIFDDIFEEYTTSSELVRVKTTSMGSLFQLFYRIELKDSSCEKELIDEIRCRNGNLDIICGIPTAPIIDQL